MCCLISELVILRRDGYASRAMQSESFVIDSAGRFHSLGHDQFWHSKPDQDLSYLRLAVGCTVDCKSAQTTSLRCKKTSSVRWASRRHGVHAVFKSGRDITSVKLSLDGA
ncbi:hypothetical protein O181_028537 [Austropuccinia psidii MF-1]|uniref:Uncharacterized protein n=1 Tax=Austropuccinia psidii MF-1 TaxID=1389203 RepID=A0A9Q3CUS7_9BASI|nr:hypothetical protein [Austropuccinia psidii MF-1]